MVSSNVSSLERKSGFQLMALYWSLFFIPAILALSPGRSQFSAYSRAFLYIYALLVIVLLGLRFEVGPDWFLYKKNMKLYASLDWQALFFYSDPAYSLLNKIATEMGYGLWFPNLVCAAVLVIGVVSFSLRMPNPWMAIAVAVPYVFIVLIVNYTRQAAAFGFELLALVSLYKGNIRRFYLLVFIATAFHKTALFILFFGFFYPSQRPILNYLGMLILFVILFYLFFSGYTAALIANYFGSKMQSGGAFVRVLMNASAGAIFLIFRKYFNLSPALERFWIGFSLISLLFIVLLEISPSSTAVDRLALYVMPLQLFVYSHIPEILFGRGQKILSRGSIIFVYAAVLFIWFQFGNFSWAWIPYRFYPLEFEI